MWQIATMMVVHTSGTCSTSHAMKTMPGCLRASSPLVLPELPQSQSHYGDHAACRVEDVLASCEWATVMLHAAGLPQALGVPQIVKCLHDDYATILLHAAGLPQALGVPQIVKAAEALVARVETSAGSMSALSRSASRELPPLQAPSGQPSPG